MEKLNLPIIREDPPPSKSLSMDHYIKFLRTCRRYVLNRTAYEDWKKRSVVDVPFRLK